jgi:hypothetical protein
MGADFDILKIRLAGSLSMFRPRQKIDLLLNMGSERRNNASLHNPAPDPNLSQSAQDASTALAEHHLTCYWCTGMSLYGECESRRTNPADHLVALKLPKAVSLGMRNSLLHLALSNLRGSIRRLPGLEVGRGE